MSENNFNLDELNELKQAYQLIDEKLDDKEIVTPEQIRRVTLDNIGFLKRSFKKDFSWSYLAFIPFLAVYFAIHNTLSVTGWWVLGIYSILEIALRILLICMTNRVDHSELDIRTLLDEESRYMKADFAIASLGFVFWTAFNFLFVGTGSAVVFLVIVVLIILSKTRFFRRKLTARTWRDTRDLREPGKVRKFIALFFSIILIILVVLLTISSVYNAVGTQINIFDLLSRAGFLMACVTVILQGMFMKKIRNGYDKPYKAVMIVGALTIAIASIPLVHLMNTKGDITQINYFPIMLALIVLYTCSVARRK